MYATRWDQKPPRGIMDALAVTASFCAGNGRLFATIGPCLSVGSNRLLWLAGAYWPPPEQLLFSRRAQMSEKCIGSRHTHEQSVLAQAHDCTSFPGIMPGNH